MELKNILTKSKEKAINGGIAGASAMFFQVSSLMWMRTTMNYQYANGGTISNTIKLLYSQGGILRFYKGYSAAIIQGPISRFGDTATNMGILELTKDTRLPLYIRTGLASISSGCFRILLMPIDTFKTTLQVHGKDGFKIIRNKIKMRGIRTLWNGSLATASATMVGHYPWFMTYNYLNFVLDNYQDSKAKKLSRQAFIGFSSSVVSDVCSNSLRVLKTSRQTHTTNISYVNVAKNIINKDGFRGLFFRGLDTRIITNGINGMMFSVLWKIFMDKNKD